MASGQMRLVMRRLGLPLLLGLAAVAAWLVSARLGDVSVEAASGAERPGLATPLVSVRRAPTALIGAEMDQRQAELAASIPKPSTSLACAIVMVDGNVVYELRPDTSLIPGYAQLLATGHVALDRLGPDYRFLTEVMAPDPVTEDGRVTANLYLIGGGDPGLMSHVHAHSFRPLRTTRTPIEHLAQAVVDAGVGEILGAVIGVERRYDAQRGLTSWPAIYGEAGLVGPLGALQVDDALVSRPAPNRAGAVAVPAEDPSAHAASLFDDLLESHRVTIHGLARAEYVDEEPPDLVPIAAIESPPLADIVAEMWAVNDAGAAEMLIKEIGYDFRRQGTTQAGAEAIRFTLDSLGVELSVAPRDASGLDPVSTSTCRTLADLAAAIPADHPTLHSLPGHEQPGVYAGALADLELDADLGLVGGTTAEATSFVARTIDPEADATQVVVASIVNRATPLDTPNPDDLALHRALVESIDEWRNVTIAPAIGNPGP